MRDIVMRDFFRKAKPVWAEGRSREMNLTLGFYGEFGLDFAGGMKEEGNKGTRVVLRITGASVYRVFLNGEFIGHGPARAAHGYYRVDELELDQVMLRKKNQLAVEAVGFCMGSFYVLDQESFLQVEVCVGEKVLLATGADQKAEDRILAAGTDGIAQEAVGLFHAKVLDDRLQKVQRYSYQRVAVEAYRLKEGYDSWRVEGFGAGEAVRLDEEEEKQLLERHVAYSRFPVIKPVNIIAWGEFLQDQDRELWEDRSFRGITEEYKGYPVEELELWVSREMDRTQTLWIEPAGEEGKRSNEKKGADDSEKLPLQSEGRVLLEENQFMIAEWEYNATGFAGARIECCEDCTLMYVFDEVLTEDGDVSYNRMCCVNAVSFELEKGVYRLETIQPYTQKYGKWMVKKGKACIRGLWIREYTNPEADRGQFVCSDPVINGIFEGGRRTFAQNAVDIYMDCPSRERAGWLCDSFFTGRVEAVLTGDTKVEDNFLENFCLPESFDHIPKGMLPMCYPADHTTGEFIPNWALWLVPELEEYHARKPGETITDAMFDKIEDMFRYFEAFENEDGLLENLEGWIFVEWSRANELVDGVNYPSNMLYSAALRAAGNIYDSDEWRAKGDRVAAMVRQQSWQGEFFRDQALRKGGRLQVQEESTEVCQYYAFVLGIADRETYPGLFETLCGAFGPERDAGAVYPDIAQANAFIGNYLRIEMLSHYGLSDRIIEETRMFFDYMVRRTGTLWENTGAYASCNHGFASHIIYVCFRDLLGVCCIDYDQRCIELSFEDNRLEHCRGRIPVADSWLEIIWKREGEALFFDYTAPAKYTVRVRNRSGKEIEKRRMLNTRL